MDGLLFLFSAPNSIMMTLAKWFRRLARESLVLVLGGSLGLFTARGADSSPLPVWDTFNDTWTATDARGRSLPSADEAGPIRAHRTVGIFYFLWQASISGPIHDLSDLLAANPTNPFYGPPHAFHWWGKPWFGYYRGDDSLVIRKHAQMLGDAGVDVLIFDVTNGPTYDEVYLAICRIFESLRKMGQRTPQIAFITHSSGGRVAQKLYENFYAKGLYSGLWFRWQGKPLLLADAKDLSPQAQDFFTVRESWAWSNPKDWFGNGRDKWPWLDHTPQQPGWHDDPQKPEEISVCAAEHPTSNIGRSFHQGRQPATGQTDPAVGLYFGEQWQRALAVDPEFIFVTGWNEWVAQRFLNTGGIHFLGRPLAQDETFFVDQYSQEFSRDIEPMQGGHGDNYYYQMAANIRRFKGARTLPPVTPGRIRIDGRFDDWKLVEPEFRDNLGDPVQRHHAGAGNAGLYRNETGRNDLVAAKVSYDKRNVYFYVRTREPLTSPADPNWMLLFIDVDRNPTNGWLGYDIVVNRVPVQRKNATLERHRGVGYRWGSPANLTFRSAGNELELAIPRALLDIKQLPATLDFKWADNIQQTGEASDFTLNGDAAPNDRYNYRAKLRPAAP